MRLIDADALREEYCEGCSHETQEDCKTDPVCAAMMWVGDAPTVAPESLRATGEWEIANDGTHFCSRCGCDAIYTWDDIDRNFINSVDDVPDRPSNYCPNCGAKMKGS